MSEARMLGEMARQALATAREAADPWQPLLDGGWIGVGVPESRGGGGGGLAEACALAEASGATGSDAPVVEAILAAIVLGLDDGARESIEPFVAGWPRTTLALATTAATGADPRGLRVGPGEASVVALPSGDDVEVCLLLHEDLEIARHRNLAGEERGLITAPDRFPAVPHRIVGGRAALERAVAAVTAARTLGAMRAAHELSVGYARDRRQFGRSIGSFQAIAHSLVAQAGDVAQVEAALAAACRPDPQPLAAHAARVLADAGGERLAASAHQVHGAIGTTREHELHRYTLRLVSWGQELGPSRYWARRLGALAAAGGAGWWDATSSSAAGSPR